MTVTTTADTSFSKTYLHLAGPLVLSEPNKNRYILTVQDELTKFSEADALPNKEAKTVSKKLFLLRYGI